MPYDSDWNWIMSVWKKIQKMYFKGFPLNTTIGSSGAVISINESNASGEKYEGDKIISNTMNADHYGISLEESVAIAILQFVKWYNKNITTEKLVLI